MEITRTDEVTPDFAALAKMATDNAVRDLFAAGIPVVYMSDGRLVRRFPDGREEYISDEELREVSGGVLP